MFDPVNGNTQKFSGDGMLGSILSAGRDYLNFRTDLSLKKFDIKYGKQDQAATAQLLMAQSDAKKAEIAADKSEFWGKWGPFAIGAGVLTAAAIGYRVAFK